MSLDFRDFYSYKEMKNNKFPYTGFMTYIEKIIFIIFLRNSRR